MEGAVVQGIGLAMIEYFDWHQGTPTDPQYIDYPLPSADFIPKMHVGFADSYEPSGPFGAKGLGDAQIAYYDQAFATLAATDEWKKDVEKNYWVNNYQPSREAGRYWAAQYRELEEILTELGLAKKN